MTKSEEIRQLQTADEDAAFDPGGRDDYGALRNPPGWVTELLRDVERAGAWVTGIESDKKQRGSSINTAVYSVARGLALVQVRECVFHPRRFNRVRKDYYLCGRNEIGTVFAHPVEARASGRVVGHLEDGVEIALSRIWGCKETELDEIVRNGDVAFVPAGKLPEGAVLVETNEATVRESHHVRTLGAGQLYRAPDGQLYVKGRAKIEHSKGQHPTARVKGGIWRVVAGARAKTWGFSAPTAD